VDSQLNRVVLKICILQLVLKEDRYGYDIVKIMRKYFKDTDESTFYTIMRRLSSEKLTEMYYSDISKGPMRKYYKITGDGKKYLLNYINSWKKIEDVFCELGILSE